MFCPRCSQRQISDDVRFCPGCGFQLNVVSELLSNNGALVRREAEEGTKLLLLRRKGIRIGAKLIFLSAFLLPLAIGFSVRYDSPIPFIAPFIIFLMGSAQLLYTLLFSDYDQSELPESQPAGLSAARRFDLPAGQITPIPISDSKRVNTAEMVRPPSVTEHTTQLLNDND